MTVHCRFSRMVEFAGYVNLGGHPTVWSVMLFGVINIYVFLHASPLLLKPWWTMTEQADITQPVVVPSEPSDAVKE